MLEDLFERPVGRHELRRRLLTDARDAGEVVARVAAERRVHGVLLRGDARTLDDPRLVVQHVVGHAASVVEDLDVRVRHELVGVPVAGDDDHVGPGLGGTRGECGDDVVGFDALHLEGGNLQRVDHLVDQRELRHEEVRRFLAPGLVLGVEVVAERAPGRVEDDRDRSGRSSVSTFTSIDVNPYTVSVTVPFGVARSVGSA